MTQPTPETIGPQLHSQIGTWVMGAARYLGEQDAFQVRGWERGIAQLEAARADLASVVRAKLAEAHGRMDQVEYWIDNAKKLGAPHEVVTETYLVACSNLGFATKGLKSLRTDVDIKYGNIGSTIRLTCSIGAFQQLDRLLDQVQKGNVDISQSGLVPEAATMGAVLRGAGVSDDECAAVVDVAGEVMRSRGLYWTGLQPDYVIDEVAATVLLRYHVAVTPQEASAMTLEAIDTLIAKDLDRSPFMIGFFGEV